MSGALGMPSPDTNAHAVSPALFTFNRIQNQVVSEQTMLNGTGNKHKPETTAIWPTWAM